MPCTEDATLKPAQWPAVSARWQIWDFRLCLPQSEEFGGELWLRYFSESSRVRCVIHKTDILLWEGKLILPEGCPDSNLRHSLVVLLWTSPSLRLSLVLLQAGFTYILGRRQEPHGSRDYPMNITFACRGRRALHSARFYPSYGLTGI